MDLSTNHLATQLPARTTSQHFEDAQLVGWRACACFGLGRYLYYFDGVWVDLDERKRPKTALKLFDGATPEGWRRGLRPQLIAGAHSDAEASASVDSGSQNQQPLKGDIAELVCQIEAFETPRGKALYRGLLKRVARVWRPTQIQDVVLLRRLLAHMQGAERGSELPLLWEMRRCI
jgi:hypothetical protein